MHFYAVPWLLTFGGSRGSAAAPALLSRHSRITIPVGEGSRVVMAGRYMNLALEDEMCVSSTRHPWRLGTPAGAARAHAGAHTTTTFTMKAGFSSSSGCTSISWTAGSV